MNQFYKQFLVWTYPLHFGKKDGYFPSSNEKNWNVMLQWSLLFNTSACFELGPEPQKAQDILVWKSFHFSKHEDLLPMLFGFRGGHFMHIKL